MIDNGCEFPELPVLETEKSEAMTLISDAGLLSAPSRAEGASVGEAGRNK